MSKHTPGPWIPTAKNGKIPTSIFVEGYGYIASLNYGQRNELADARLIAAAPELLEALRRVMEQVADTGTCNQIEGTRAMSAIAKATGA